MSLRQKTLLILSFLVLFILLSLYTLGQLIVNYSSGKLEVKNSIQYLDQMEAVFKQDEINLRKNAAELAEWDETYHYIEAQESPFILRNINELTYLDNRLNLIAFVNSQGEIVYGEVYNEEMETLAPISQAIAQHLSTGGLLVNLSIFGNTVSGIMRLPQAPMLVVSTPILTSNGEGPPHGKLILGRYLDAQEIRSFAERTHLWVNLHHMDDPNLPEDVAKAARVLSEMTEEKPTFVQSLGDHTVAGYSIIRDIYGQSIIIARIEVPREEYRRGMTNARYFTFSILIFALILCVLMPLLLDKLIFSRLSTFCSNVSKIGTVSDFAGRLPVSGNDELTSLAVEINKMLASLQKSEGELQRYSQNLAEVVDEKIAELSINEGKLRGIFASSPDAILVTDPKGTIIDHNPATLHMLGFDDDSDIKGRRVLEFISVKDHFKVAESAKKILEQSYIEKVEYTLLRRDGMKFLAELSTSIISDADDKTIYFVTIFRDISVRKRSEKALTLSEQRYRVLFERNLAGVFRATQEGLFVDCNDSFVRILGCVAKEEIVGRSLMDFDFSSAEGKSLLSLLRQREIIANLEFKIMRADHDVAWGLGNVGLTQEEDQPRAIIQGTLIDITESKSIREHEQEMQLELMEQSKLASIGLLAAGITHNLNVPLQGIMSSVELLKMDHKDLPYLDDVLNQVERIMNIISNILHKARQDQDQSKKEINLNELLSAELEFQNADLFFKHNIEKDYNFDPNIPNVVGTYSDFSQALMNIIKNAVDAMYSCSEKKLSVNTKALEDGNIVVEIKDTGCGISSEKFDAIFDPFYTTKPPANDQVESEPFGTGLGLSSAKQLMSKYNALIEVDSVVDAGTTFRITIPTQETFAEEEVFSESEEAIVELV